MSVASALKKVILHVDSVYLTIKHLLTSNKKRIRHYFIPASNYRLCSRKIIHLLATYCVTLIMGLIQNVSSKQMLYWYGSNMCFV